MSMPDSTFERVADAALEAAGEELAREVDAYLGFWAEAEQPPDPPKPATELPLPAWAR